MVIFLLVGSNTAKRVSDDGLATLGRTPYLDDVAAYIDQYFRKKFESYTRI
jgi:hypothetical protein